MSTTELIPFKKVIGSVEVTDISPSTQATCRIQMFVDKGHNTISSNLVYPHMQGYRNVCQVEPKWLNNMIAKMYGIRSKRMFSTNQVIDNKYAIEINGKLYLNQDGRYYLIEIPKS